MKSILDRPVLTLNRSWKAIGTLRVRDAIVLMSRDSAKGLCVNTFRAFTWSEWISDKENPPMVEGYISRGDSVAPVPAPEVIILSKYNEVYRRSVRFTKKAMYRRDSYICQYCLKPFTEEELSVDHVIPRANGGKTSWTNCVTACKTCNNKKADRSLKEAGLILHRKPQSPQWNPILHVRKENRPESWKNLVNPDWLES